MESAYTLNINSPEKTKKIKKVIKSIWIYIAYSLPALLFVFPVLLLVSRSFFSNEKGRRENEGLRLQKIQKRRMIVTMIFTAG